MNSREIVKTLMLSKVYFHLSILERLEIFKKVKSWMVSNEVIYG